MCSSHHSAVSDLATNRRLKYAVLLNCAFVVLEFTAGILSGSLALVTDSIHNAIDSVTLLVAWLAGRLAQRPPDRWRTYGYHRAPVLAALLNGFVLLVVMVVIGYHAVERFQEPVQVHAGIVAITGLIGIVANLGVVMLLRQSQKRLHVRAAYLHNLTDAASSALVVVSGALIYLTGAYWVDLVLSLVICGLLGKSLLPTLRDAVHILMEGAPEGADPDRIKAAIMERFPEVTDVHHIHVWLTGDGMSALTCHIVVRPDVTHERDHELVANVRGMLKEDFDIAHPTIESEHESCETAKACDLERHE